MKYLLILTLSFFLPLLPKLSSVVYADQNAVVDLQEQLLSLREEHQRALQLSQSYPTRGREAHTLVAGKLESLWQAEDINQGALAYNIGSSWFHAGRYGESVLWYRRAESLGYGSKELSHNLSHVRKQRLDYLPDSFGNPWLATTHSIASSSLWFWFAIAVYLLFWWQVWVFIRSDRTEKSRIIFAASIMLLTSVITVFRVAYTPEDSSGVITAMDITARKGPGLVFAPAFTSPLNQGTEFILLQEHANWQEIRLSNGSTAWLPTRATTLIDW
ncbi:hypothetical protein GZ77_25490 [Endozoicomonas montiporae]|uniref:SH3b domain-containing protein n=2 Tax=Endozoicomonas montiporae TaxID=1027273 RepID=A0A081MZ33_9GAMM|nr:hypothetical protein [Endozoicomonas montiporae]AMO54929.1 hypothetical protein EZMO1_0692 [Endozoicomonas montiporae CL-33]KEQ11456.1 hypothetical protein GZ77_25490 [Endozoicomonas montiporae]